MTGWKNTLKRTGKKFALDRCTMTAESERQAAAEAGHPGAQASARHVESGRREAR